MITETATGAIATKSKSLAVYFGISAPAVAYLGLDVDIMTVWAVLMIIDVILGTVISVWLNTFKSRTGNERFARKGVLVLIVCSVAITGTIYAPIAWIAQSMLLAFTINELVSIIRHAYTIYAKEKIPESDVIKSVLKGGVILLEKMATEKNGK